VLSKLLAYLRSGGDANISTISRKLEIEEGTIIMLFDQLVKMGYLEEIMSSKEENDFCSSIKCKNCSKLVSCEDLLKVKYRLVK
jgi:hypothetical protein